MLAPPVGFFRSAAAWWVAGVCLFMTLAAASVVEPTRLAAVILALGSLIAVLLLLLVCALADRQRQRARHAEDMTRLLHDANAPLLDSAQHASAIVQHVADAIFTVASDGRIVQQNPAAERLFGYAANTMANLRLPQLLPALPAELWPALAHELDQNGTARTTLRDLDARRADGSEVAIEMSLSRINETEPALIAAVCREVTDRRRVDQLKRDFVSTVSHELRTPMTSISGALGLVLASDLSGLPLGQQELLKIAHRNSRRLTELVNDLLDMEQLSRGQMQFYAESVTVPPLIKTAIKNNSQFASQYGVQLEFTDANNTAAIFVDRNRLLQVVNNLLSNAIKYSPQDGSVRVAVETIASGIRISVSDQGPGVAKELEAALFERFVGAATADKRPVGGPGFGLAISKEITERMGGRIGYQALSPHGARFFIEFSASL